MLSVVMLAQAFMESFIWSVPICDVFLAVFQFAAGTWQTRLAFVTDDDGLFVPRCLYPDSLLVRRSFCLAWNFLEALVALVLGHRDVDLSEAQGGNEERDGRVLVSCCNSRAVCRTVDWMEETDSLSREDVGGPLTLQFSMSGS